MNSKGLLRLCKREGHRSLPCLAACFACGEPLLPEFLLLRLPVTASLRRALAGRPRWQVQPEDGTAGAAAVPLLPVPLHQPFPAAREHQPTERARSRQVEDTPEKLAAVGGKAGAEEQVEAEQSAAPNSGKLASTKPVASAAAVADAVGAAAAAETAAAAVAGWQASGVARAVRWSTGVIPSLVAETQYMLLSRLQLRAGQRREPRPRAVLQTEGLQERSILDPKESSPDLGWLGLSGQAEAVGGQAGSCQARV